MSSSSLDFDHASKSGEKDQLIRVLVVDIGEESDDLFNTIFSSDSYQVITVNSSSEGVRLVQEVHPDVIVVDLSWPEVNDINICKEVRQVSNIPILMLSASNQPGIVTKALDEGADEFLTKPVTSSVLIAHVKKLARRSRAEKNASRGNGKFRM